MLALNIMPHDVFQYRDRPIDPHWQALSDCASAALSIESPKVIVASDVRPAVLGQYRWYVYSFGAALGWPAGYLVATLLYFVTFSAGGLYTGPLTDW